MTNPKSTFCEDKEMLDIMKKYYQIQRNLIIQHNFVEDYNRYRAENFSVH